jgi:hypothetical protein
VPDREPTARQNAAVGDPLDKAIKLIDLSNSQPRVPNVDQTTELTAESPHIPAKLSPEDLRFWARLPGWTVREQAALLLGLDPGSPADLASSEFFARYRLMLKRAKRMQLLKSPAPPLYVLEWAKSNGIPVPEDLKQAVAGERRLRNWKTKYFRLRREALNNNKGDEDVNPKTKTSLERLLLLMAIESYGYKLQGNSETAGILADIADKFDSRIIGEDAIRTRLKAAGEEHGYLFKIDGKSVS